MMITAATPAALAVAIDAYLQPLKQHHALSGALVVERDGKIVVQRNYGTAANTPFCIASITKTFTAAAIETLAEHGRLKLDDPIANYIPAFPNAKAITIRMLLLHRGGLADPDYPSLVKRAATLDEIIQSIASKPPLFPPGTQERYSNAGFVMLSKIIEVASGQPYGNFIAANFARPLKLAHTFAVSAESPVAPRFVPGPPPAFRVRVPLMDMTAYTGSGILAATAVDLVKWADAVTNDRVVPLAHFEYPYGWGVRHYFGDDVLVQSGEIEGAISYVARYRKAHVTVAYLSNVEVGPNDLIGRAIGALALGQKPGSPLTWPAESSKQIAVDPSGTYSGPVGTASISGTGGALYWSWTGGIVPQYLQPIGPSRFFAPVDASFIDVINDGQAITLKRTWGSFTATFTEQRP